MKKAPPPPSGEAPVTREVVEIVKKKKVGQPLGPPPAGMANFKAPKEYSPKKKQTKDESSDEEDNIDTKPHQRTVGGGHSGYDYEDNMKSQSKSKYDKTDVSAHKHENPRDIKRDNEPKSKISKVSASTTRELFNFGPILLSTYRELRAFALSPMQPGYVTRCYIERSRPMSKLFAPHYSLCADMEDGTGRELIVARKMLKCQTPHYIFSLKSDDLYRKREQRSRLYLGKLRGISPNEYVLYDNGICFSPDGKLPDGEEQDEEELEAAEYIQQNQKESSNNSENDHSLYRKELAIISYHSKKRPMNKGERGMEVGIPFNNFVIGGGQALADSNGIKMTKSVVSAASVKPGGFNSLVIPFKKVQESGQQNFLHAKKVFFLHEKNSRYDPLSSCLVDFKGRANVPSIKNCQFIESEPMNENNPEDQEKREFLLQLGKTTNDCFNMDFKHPLSLLQAFAICITRFDSNVSW